MFANDIMGFYDLSIAEIKAFIDAKVAAKKLEAKEKAMDSFISNQHLASLIGGMFDKHYKAPKFEAIYGHLLEDADRLAIETHKAKAELALNAERIKASMFRYMSAHNAKGVEHLEHE